jgi:hypothetical protein
MGRNWKSRLGRGGGLDEGLMKFMMWLRLWFERPKDTVSLKPPPVRKIICG